MDAAAIPRLARGVKLREDAVRGRWIVLAPERMFVPDEIALEVLRLPDSLAPRREGNVTQLGHATQSAAAQAQGVAAGLGHAGFTPPGVTPPGLTPAGFTPNVIRGNFALQGARAGSDAPAVHLPLYGRIAAGQPIEALRDSATIEVPAALLGQGEHYALEVAGDSMVEAGILDGDTVLIRRSDSADSGSIVVALIDETEVTLKRLRKRGNSVALEPANARYETRIFGPDRVKVQGRLVGLLRRYS